MQHYNYAKTFIAAFDKVLSQAGSDDLFLQNLTYGALSYHYYIYQCRYNKSIK
jgi:hypothetical protein